ncbi:flagellar protein FliS [Gordonibacter pamelaeae]
MSKQDRESAQSLPVDSSEPNASSHQWDGEKLADDAAGKQVQDVSPDSASVRQILRPEAPDPHSSATSTAVETAKNAGKILGMSKHVFAGLVAVVAVAAAVVAGVVLTQQPAVEDWFDSNAAQGQFEGKSKEEIQAALNEEVAKGMMNISIAAVITFPDGTSEGEARIENIAANPMDQKVTIALKDGDEVVYESGAIAPDQHIQNIKLSKDLDPGEYPAIATFTGYDRETHKQTGQAAAKITLRVEG